MLCWYVLTDRLAPIVIPSRLLHTVINGVCVNVHMYAYYAYDYNINVPSEACYVALIKIIK